MGSSGSCAINRRQAAIQFDDDTIAVGVEVSRQVPHASSPLSQSCLVRANRRVSVALLVALVLTLFCPPSAQAADPNPALQEAAASLQKGDFAGAELKLRAELK